MKFASLFRFQQYLKNVKSYQIVYDLKRRRSKGLASMLPAHEFLKNLKF